MQLVADSLQVLHELLQGYNVPLILKYPDGVEFKQELLDGKTGRPMSQERHVVADEQLEQPIARVEQRRHSAVVTLE